MKKIVDIKWTKTVTTKFVEYGIDPDNNRFIIGVSSEIELPDGTEKRIHGRVPLKLREVYLRIWLFRVVFCIGTSSVSLKIKDRNSFKLLLGFGGV